MRAIDPTLPCPTLPFPCTVSALAENQPLPGEAPRGAGPLYASHPLHWAAMVIGEPPSAPIDRASSLSAARLARAGLRLVPLERAQPRGLDT